MIFVSTHTQHGVSHLFLPFLAELVDGYKVLTEATPEQKKSQRSTWSQLQAIADMKFTYVAACQMYGEQKRQGHHSATEILKLMLKYVPGLSV